MFVYVACLDKRNLFIWGMADTMTSTNSPAPADAMNNFGSFIYLVARQFATGTDDADIKSPYWICFVFPALTLIFTVGIAAKRFMGPLFAACVTPTLVSVLRKALESVYKDGDEASSSLLDLLKSLEEVPYACICGTLVLGLVFALVLPRLGLILFNVYNTLLISAGVVGHKEFRPQSDAVSFCAVLLYFTLVSLSISYRSIRNTLASCLFGYFALWPLFRAVTSEETSRRVIQDLTGKNPIEYNDMTYLFLVALAFSVFSQFSLLESIRVKGKARINMGKKYVAKSGQVIAAE